MPNDHISPEEQDILLKIAKEAMGSAADVFSELLGQSITLGDLSVQSFASLAEKGSPFAGDEPAFLVSVQYADGNNGPGAVLGPSAFLLRESDAKRIAHQMMGNDPAALTPEPLTEMEQNTLVDAMSQVMTIVNMTLTGEFSKEVVLKVQQAMPYGEDLCAPLIEGGAFGEWNGVLQVAEDGTSIPLLHWFPMSVAQQFVQLKQPVESKIPMPTAVSSGPFGGDDFLKQFQQSQSAPVTVQPVQFPSFDTQASGASGGHNKNLDLVLDVHLNMSVELGKSELSIKEVLELARGSVIELDRFAGEPVDLMANGKLIAKGEVVVIEDHFGLRITSIISPSERVKGL